MSAAPLKIMPLGDSITRFGRCPADSSGNAPDSCSTEAFVKGYRYFLWKKLDSAGLAGRIDFIGTQKGPKLPGYDEDHQGLSGWTARQILAGSPEQPGEGRLGEWTEAFRPDFALIHLGTNDVATNRATADIIADLRAIIDTLRLGNPEVTILLAQILPMTSQWGFDAKGAELNAALPSLVAAAATDLSPVLLVDQYTGMDRAADFMDQVHPNNPGCLKMAERWFAALKPALEKKLAATGVRGRGAADPRARAIGGSSQQGRRGGVTLTGRRFRPAEFANLDCNVGPRIPFIGRQK